MNTTGDSDRMCYETPSVTTFATADVIDALGPAQGMASGIAGGPGLGPVPGITSSTDSGTNRHYGR